MSDKATKLAQSFRKVIRIYDPVANSEMTDASLPVKILADWGREACVVLKADGKQIADLQAENKRLKEILDKFVCQENYCGSDGKEVEIIVPIEVYHEAGEQALKDTNH